MSSHRVLFVHPAGDTRDTRDVKASLSTFSIRAFRPFCIRPLFFFFCVVSIILCSRVWNLLLIQVLLFVIHVLTFCGISWNFYRWQIFSSIKYIEFLIKKQMNECPRHDSRFVDVDRFTHRDIIDDRRPWPDTGNTRTRADATKICCPLWQPRFPSILFVHRDTWYSALPTSSRTKDTFVRDRKFFSSQNKNSKREIVYLFVVIVIVFYFLKYFEQFFLLAIHSTIDESFDWKSICNLWKKLANFFHQFRKFTKFTKFTKLKFSECFEICNFRIVTDEKRFRSRIESFFSSQNKTRTVKLFIYLL